MSVVLRNAVIARISAEILKQLTQDDPNIAAVDNAKIDAAASDTIGQFQRRTGIKFDDQNITHIAVGVQGVMAHLELYRSRNSNVFSQHMKEFYSACVGIENKVYHLPVTSSNLDVPRERDGTLPDMHKNKRVFRGRARSKNLVREVNDDYC